MSVYGFPNGMIYRAVMRLAHRFHWHYAPPIYPDGDTLMRCEWCGFSQVVKRGRLRKDLIQSSPGKVAR